MGIPDIDWTLLGAIASVLQAPIAILALCVALITAYFNAWPVWRQRQVDRTVLKTFGADSYTKEEVLAATVDYVDPECLDEDVEAAGDYREELRRVMDASSDFRGVVLTCRTQFFRSDEEVPKETGILKVMSRPAGESGSYRFYKLYIAPFWPKEINAYLRKRFPIWKLRSRNKAMKIVMRLGDLAMRPMLLAIVPDLVNREEQVSTLAQLYDAMVGLWLDRESHWIANAVLGRV